MKLIACSGFGLSLLLAVALPAAAQNQTPSNSSGTNGGASLGDYARQVRKPSGNAKPKVFDNDNLPTDDKLSVVGKAPEASEAVSEPKQEDSSVPAADAAKASGEKKPGDASSSKLADEQAAKDQANKQWAAKLTAQKNQIDLSQRELDVLQREYQLRAAEMYADVGNRLRNSADWDQKDAQYKTQIADKQKAIDEAKQQLDEMQEEARKAGVPSSVREP